MRSPLAASLVALAAFASACGDGSSEATDVPPPTIGLGSELEPVDEAAFDEVRAVGADGVDTIVMIGDSITVASQEAIEAGFAELAFDDVRISAQSGKRMALTFGGNTSGAEVAALLTVVPDDDSGEGPEPLGPDHGDELWIVALGTNDIGQYASPAELAGAVNEVLGAVPADAPLIWVDTHISDRPDGAAEVNAIVADRLARRGNAVIAHWSEVAADDGVLRGDGVHPSSDGTAVFAAVVTARAASFLGRD